MMDDDSAHDGIERLEARIEKLAESIDRCRQIALIAKLAIAAGFVWLALMLLAFVPFAPAALVAAIAAVIGGTVLFGANSSTWKEKEAARAEAEAERAALIGQLDLHVVGDRRRLH